MPAIGSIFLFASMNPLGNWLRDHGSTGIAVYVAGFALFTGLALMPTYSSAILGGWAFGFAWGYPAALMGFLFGSLIAYLIARPTASERVEGLINEHPKWRAVHDTLVRGSMWKTLGIVALLRLPPSSPFAMTNLVLASVRVPLPIYLLGTLVGMAPRTGVVLYLASQIHGELTKDNADRVPRWFWIVGIVASVLVFGALALIAKRGLAHVTRDPAPAGT